MTAVAKPLVLRRKGDSGLTLDGSPLRPDRLGSMARTDIAALKIRAGARKHRLDELFEIEGDPCPHLQILGSANWMNLGAGLIAGELLVDHAGDLCGSRMTGGSVIARSAGDSLGAGMSGGTIRVSGDAGAFVGGPAPDTTRGMTGGEILIGGSAGERAGHRMRRGTVAIAGTAHQYPGHAMIAGTLVVGRGPLRLPGLEMKRGSIVALDADAAHELGPHLGFDGRFEPVILRVLLKHLAGLGVNLPAGCRDAVYAHHSGDKLGMGRGEVFVRLR